MIWEKVTDFTQLPMSDYFHNKVGPAYEKEAEISPTNTKDLRSGLLSIKTDSRNQTRP